MLLAVARIPDRPDARAQAATATGMALADLNRRLAGTLPRILVPGLPPAEAPGVVAALEALGFLVVTCDVSAVPGDDERVIARRIDFAGGLFVATDSKGDPHDCAPEAIALLQRGTRVSTVSEKVTTSERRLTVGRAVMSGGLLLTKKVEKTTVRTTETAERFLLVQRADGEPDIMIYERRLDYRSLGDEMQASSHYNFERLWQRLDQLAPNAVDDRVARPGFVSGLPATAAHPVDLALFLVALARRLSA